MNSPAYQNLCEKKPVRAPKDVGVGVMIGGKERGDLKRGEIGGKEEGENLHTKFMTYFNKTHAGTEFACKKIHFVLLCAHFVGGCSAAKVNPQKERSYEHPRKKDGHLHTSGQGTQ